MAPKAIANCLGNQRCTIRPNAPGLDSIFHLRRLASPDLSFIPPQLTFNASICACNGAFLCRLSIMEMDTTEKLNANRANLFMKIVTCINISATVIYLLLLQYVFSQSSTNKCLIQLRPIKNKMKFIFAIFKFKISVFHKIGSRKNEIYR
jgi:hypothetical protein